MSTSECAVADFVFVGFNKNVVALDRYTGEVAWSWKSPQGSGFVSLLLDGDRLIVGVNGYMYCLDPVFGQEVWSNPMRGFGLGVTSTVSARGRSDNDAAAAEVKRQADAAAAAAAT